MNSKLYSRMCLLTLLLTGVTVTNAQINNYTFSQAEINGTEWGGSYQYTLKPSNTSINPLKCIYAGDTIGSSTSSITGLGFPIGFDFTYNGEVFDRIAVGGNGYIKLGKSGEAITILNDTTPGTIFDNTELHKNIIASLQVDAGIFGPQPGNVSAIDLGVSGIPGNRKCTIDYYYYGNNGISWEYEIQLFEINNCIRFVYSSAFSLWPPYNIHGKVAVGITGNQDFINRKITSGVNTWITSVQGSSNTDLCDLNSSLLPVSSNMAKIVAYTWMPPVPAPTAPSCPYSFFYGDTTFDGFTYHPVILADGAIGIETNPILNWSNVSLATHQATTYDVYLDTDYPPTVKAVQNLTDTFYAPPTLAPNTKYYYNIVPKNASGKDSSCIGSFTTDSVPHYCFIGMLGDGYINTVTLNTFSFVYSSASGNAAIYQFPAVAPYTTTLKRDTSYTCSVTLVGQTPPPFDPWGRANVDVFIDFNHDGDFDDPGETMVGGSAVPNGSLTFNVPIPANAVLGYTTMRISSKNVAQASPFVSCDGDASPQDFIINIAPTTSCQAFNMNPIANNVICYGQNNGSIDLNLSGGATPYTINWTDGSTVESRTGLAKGVYQASVTDANGCEVATPLIPIIQPAALSIDTAKDSNNAIHVLVSGGTAPYNYLWSNDSTSSVSNNFTSGTYSVKVTDAHGCDTTMQGIVISAATVTPPPPPPADSITVTDSSININVYPNPNSGTIYLQSQKQQYLHIQIVSEQGKIMNDGNYTIGNGNATPVNIAAYPAGIYFLKIVGDKSTKVVKVIKVMK